MTPYAALIAETIGDDDPATLALVEELMRTETPTLDHLSRPRFKALARQARSDADQIKAEGWLVSYCGTMRLAVPAWATSTV